MVRLRNKTLYNKPALYYQFDKSVMLQDQEQLEHQKYCIETVFKSVDSIPTFKCIMTVQMAGKTFV